jgi:hypothetical protein
MNADARAVVMRLAMLLEAGQAANGIAHERQEIYAEALRALLSDSGKGEAVTLTGAQLLEALDFVAPDRPHDADQLECEVTIQRGEGHDGPGTYCWLTEYPEEGATLLDGKAATQAECAPREAHPVAHFIYDKEDDLWEQVRGEFASDADVVPLFRRSSPESAKQGDFAAFCEHYIDASEDVNREWLFNIVSKWIQWNAAPTPERALSGEQIAILADTHLYVEYDTRHSGAPTAEVAGYEAFADAILTAIKGEQK